MKQIKRITLLITGTFLAVTTFFIEQEYFALSMLMGVSLGLIFFILADSVNRYFINRKITSVELKANEELMRAEPSTYYIGSKGVQGKLFLTSKRLIFQPQIKRGQHGKELSIERRQIKQIGNYNRAFLPTGFQIETRKEQYAFAVDDRKAWQEVLEQR
ncbi:MAG: GRAM domain-containing protein [Bacteroidota bacterium]